MSVIHLGFSKGKEQEAFRHCKDFIGLVRKTLGEHGTYPAGVHLSFDRTERHRCGVMVEYCPDVVGATETAMMYAEKAEGIWAEVHNAADRPRILKAVKMEMGR